MDKPGTVRFIRNVVTTYFGELAGSPEEMIASAWGGVGATRKLHCLSRDRISLVRELLGYAESVGGNVLIHYPAPYGPDIPALVATSVVVKPFGRVSAVAADARYANYPGVIIDVNYEVANRIASDRYGFVTLSEEILDTTEFLTMTTQGLYWGTGGGRESIAPFDAPGKLSHGKEWLYTIRGAYVIPSTIFDHIGKVNTSAITSSDMGQTFAPGTLLYAAPSVAAEVTLDRTIYRITLRFLHKDNGSEGSPMGWNYFPRPSKTGADVDFERIYDGADHAKIFYIASDFTDVFA